MLAPTSIVISVRRNRATQTGFAVCTDLRRPSARAPESAALFALFLTKTNITLALGVVEREGEKEREGKRGANDDNSGTLHELATSTLS